MRFGAVDRLGTALGLRRQGFRRGQGGGMGQFRGEEQDQESPPRARGIKIPSDVGAIVITTILQEPGQRWLRAL